MVEKTGAMGKGAEEDFFEQNQNYEQGTQIANAQYRHVLKIHQPVEYDENSKNEIIILELSDSVEFNRYVQPICIQTSDKIVRPDTVFGWSAGNSGDIHLKEFQTETKRCSHSITNAYYNQTDICIKDRGSIGFSEYDKLYIEGIVDCTSTPFIPCKEVPNFGTVALIPINAYKGWISNVTHLEYLRDDQKEQRYYKRNKVNKKFNFHCGQRPVNNPEEDIKLHQLDPYLGQWPWYAIIYHRTQDRTIEYACGCTLISEKHVITTKLCISDANGTLLDSGNIFVRFGTHIKNYYNFGYAQHRKVSKVHQPSDYAEVAERSGQLSSYPESWLLTNSSINTIVILELRNNVKFNEYVQPICIEKTNMIRLNKLIGWGAGEESKYLVQFKHNFNFTYICTKDRGSIFLYERYDGWHLEGVLDCMNIFLGNKTLGYFHMKDCVSWITNLTNLDYLRIIRKGREFDDSKQYPRILSPLSCGQTFSKYNESDPIAQLYKHPWIARIVFEEEEDNFCLGTLISHRYVLTLAYVFNFIGKSLFIRLGDYKFIQDQEFLLKNKIESLRPVRDYDVEYVVKHQSYVDSDHESTYDIALVRIKKVVLFEDHIHPVCLPVTEALQQLELSEYILTTREFCSNITFLQEFKMNKQNCSDRDAGMALCTEDFVTKYISATAGSFKCPINGAPLGQFVKFFGERFVQFGILLYWNTVWIHDGKMNENIKFTNVSYHMNWIEANMEE